VAEADPTEYASYELAAASWLRSHGYPDAHVTRSEAHTAILVRAKGAVAEVKAWSRPIGRPELHGLKNEAKSGERTFFFSRSGFTADARDYAGRPDIDMELHGLRRLEEPRRRSDLFSNRATRLVLKHRRALGIVVGVALFFFVAWELSNWIINAGPADHRTVRDQGQAAASSITHPRSLGGRPRRDALVIADARLVVANDIVSI